MSLESVLFESTAPDVSPLSGSSSDHGYLEELARVC